jgi:hypothetical protein
VGISITDGGSYFNKRKRKTTDPAALARRPNMLYVQNPDR